MNCIIILLLILAFFLCCKQASSSSFCDVIPSINYKAIPGYDRWFSNNDYMTRMYGVDDSVSYPDYPLTGGGGVGCGGGYCGSQEGYGCTPQAYNCDCGCDKKCNCSGNCTCGYGAKTDKENLFKYQDAKYLLNDNEATIRL